MSEAIQFPETPAEAGATTSLVVAADGRVQRNYTFVDGA